MKLKKLIIHNIASIEDATIDFEKNPLNSSDVFLISGKTGSGKSTILDAICLALYGNIPRLENSRMKGEIKDGEKYVNITNPSQLLRRNTGEGFVELCFKGNNGYDYISRWSIARARKRPGGNLQPKEWSLRNESCNFTYTKDIDIIEEINKAVELDFTQFCRTTMLAQGDFSKFLNSDDKQKAEILEKITGMDVYSKIGAKVYEITSLRCKAWEETKEKLNGIEVFSEEKISELTNESNEIDSSYAKIKKEIESDRIILEWLQKNREISSNLLSLRREVQNSVDALNDVDLKKKESIVNDWNRTREVRSTITSMKNNEETISKEQSEFEKLKDRYIYILKGLNQEIGNRSFIEKKIQGNKEYLEIQSHNKKTLENSEVIVVYLQSIAHSRENIKNENIKSVINKDKLSILSSELKNKEENFQVHSKELKKIEEEKNQKEIKFNPETLQNLNHNLQRNEELIGDIKLLRQRVKNYGDEADKISKKKRDLDLRKASLAAKVEEQKIKEAMMHKAKEKEERAKEIYESQKDTVDKFAIAMRAKLQIGANCPVCRQKIENVFKDESGLQELIIGYKKDLEFAEEERKTLELTVNSLKGEIALMQTTIENEIILITDSEKAIEEIIEGIISDCFKLNINYEKDQIASELKSMLDLKEKEKIELTSAIRKEEKLQSLLKTIQRNFEIKRKEVENLKDEIHKLIESINEKKKELEISSGLIAEEKIKINRVIENAKSLVMEEWKDEYPEEPFYWSKKIENSSKEYKRKIQEKEQLEKSYLESSILISTLEDSIARIKEMVSEWIEFTTEDSLKIENIQKLAENLAFTVSAKITLLKSLKISQGEMTSQIDNFINSNIDLDLKKILALNALSPEEINKLGNELTEANNRLLSAKTKLEEEEKRADLHLTQKPETLSENDGEQEFIKRIDTAEIKIRNLVEKKGGIQQLLQTDSQNKERLAKMIEEVESKKTEYDKWNRLNNLIGNTDGTKFRKIAQSYVLDSLVHGANHYMNTLSGRYRLKTVPGTFVIIVEDAYQGYVTRSVATLSGGETFLVSLSLALALSDIGTTLGVDTLFIDEGFGTLSGEPLHNAITTLRSLHSKTGKHVGIISHVEELQEKIPVQIRVEQSGHNSSSEIRILP